MPYDKIDELYDALKKDGAVSKSRENFRSKMLAPGKEGYQNRLQLYNALKADGAVESPTYEEFSKRLGMHAVTPQTTTAAPDSVPSAAPAGREQAPAQRERQGWKPSPSQEAQFARVVADTRQALRQGRQRLDNLREYAALRMGHQGGQPAFPTGAGRDKPTVFGSENVVRGGVRYNPGTGRMEQTYLTQSGNRYASRMLADMEQRRIDEALERELRPVETGLRDAYAERDRLDEALKKRMKEIDARPGRRFNDFMREAAAASTPGAGPAGEAAARMSQYENDDEYMQLMAAARMNRQTIQLLEDKKNGRMNSFWHSLATTASNGYTFSDGMSEMRDAIALQNASRHVGAINRKRAEGKPLSKEEEASEAVLWNFATDDMVQGMYGGDYGAMATAGGTTAASFDFMKDILLVPSAGGVAKGIMRGTAKGMAKGLAKLTGKEAARLWKSSVARRMLKATGVPLGAHAAGLYVANTSGIGRTGAVLGTLSSGEAVVDGAGSYKVENAMELLPAFVEAERRQAREYGSEMFGEFIPGVGGAVKRGLEKIGLSKLSGAMTRIGGKEWYRQYGSLLAAGGYSGLPGEVLEEYEGSLFDALTGHAGDAWDDMTSLRHHTDIWLGCATTGALLGSVPMAVHGYHTAQYYRYKHNMDKADRVASFRLTAERWEPLRDKIDGTPNEGMADVLTQMVLDPGLNVEEKKAVLNYARNLAKMRGHNIAQVNNANDGGEQRPEVRSVNDSYSSGYETTDPQAVNDARNRLDTARAQVAKDFGIENADEVDALIGGDPLRFIDEQRKSGNTGNLQSVIDYANAKSACDGMVQRVNDDMENRRMEVAANVERRTHKDNGAVQPATMKVDGRQVYIVKGNIVPLPDGTGIDVRDSDQSIVVCDAETGEYKFTSPDQIFNMGEPIDPQAELDEAYANIQAEHDAVLGGNGFGSTENSNPMPQYGVNDTFTMLDADGNSVGGEVQGISEDGVEIRTDVPVNGRYVQVVPAEEFENNVESINDADGNPVWAREHASDAGATADTSGGIAPQGEDVVTPTPATEELVQMARKGNELAQRQLEAQGVRWEGPAEQQQTALSRVPLDEETGEPMFEKADEETALDALNEVTGGNEANTTAIVNAQVEQAQKALDALKKKQPTKKAPTLKGSPMAMLKAQQEADASYNAAMERYGAQVAAAEEALGAWSGIYALMNERKRAVRERQEAELRERDKQLHDEAAARAQADYGARKRAEAEREAVGNERPMPAIADKWDNAPKVDGHKDEMMLPDGTLLKGRYVLHESGASSPSHNPLNWQKTEGFPMDANDNSVNDRDYERDRDAQEHTERIARNYDQRALQSVPVVSGDGVVLSGNGRTMAGEMAARNNTDGAYLDYLKAHAHKWGFTPGQVEGMQHPRVSFVPDEAMPYTAETFAKFNQQEMKSQNKTEQAVKLGKTVGDDSFKRIVRAINAHDTLGEFYNDPRASLGAVYDLHNAGVVPQAQLAEMVDGVRGQEKLSAVGREFLENMLIGKAFDSDPDVVRMLTAEPAMRQSVITALGEIADNVALGGEWALRDELAGAVKLCFDARKGGAGHGDIVSVHARQGVLFADPDQLQTVADFNDATMLMLADVLNDKRVTLLKTTIALYNQQARESARGQMDLFTGDIQSRENILRDVIKFINNGKRKEIEAARAAAVERRKAESVQQDGAPPAVSGEGEGAAHKDLSADDGRGNSGSIGERQGSVSPSAEVDENGIPFVKSDDGSTIFGEIREDSGLSPAPIKLSQGFQDENGKGYGLAHIEANHGGQIRNAGFASVEDFVRFVAQNYDEDNIRVGKRRENGNTTYLIQATDEHDNTLFIEMSRDGSYWNVNSAGVFRKGYSNKKETVAKTEPQQPTNAVSTGSSLSVSEVGGITPTEPNGKPTVSAGKNMDNPSTLQENGGISSGNKGGTPLSEQIAAASADVDTAPTGAQKAAGNYRKGHVRVGAFDITIEQPEGSVRRGTDADGRQWESRMHNAYGYFRGTEGVDGDHIDVFLSADIDGWNGREVFVVDQYNPDGGFDEHKVMLGFNGMDEAKSDYLANYEKGWEDGRRIVVSATSLEDFEKWMDSSRRKTKPFAEYAGVKKEAAANAPAKTESKRTESKGYSITPATYTNKKGKTSDVSLLTFDHDLTADQERAVKEFAKERTGEGRFAPARGWKDRESGGWMFRSEEDARKAAEMVGNEDAVADNQPLTAQELRDAVEPKKPAARKKAPAKKPANKVEVADVVEQKPSEPTKAAESAKPEKPQYEVSDEEMNGLMNDIRDILGIGDDEGDAGLKFRDPDGLTAEQRQKLMSVGQRLAMAMVERGNESFGDYASMMVKALGNKVRPWLKAFYGGLEYVPGYDKYALTPYEEVKAFDVENFDKPHKDVLAQADMIVEEGKAQVAADKANNELKEIRNEQRKETEKQTAADTDTVAAEAETVASEAESLAETSSDEQALNGAADRVDETLDKVNDQLALLGYYEADRVEKDFSEAYGYMRNAEKKAVKDAANLADYLIDDLGLDRYEATHVKADKKGKRKTKPLAVANIAPAGGDITMHLPLAEGRELYVNIQLEPSAGKGSNYGGDNLEVTGIMWRVENPNGKGNDRYGQNFYVPEDATYKVLLENVQRAVYKYIPQRTDVVEGEYKVGDKVQYSPDGREWHDAVVAQPNDMGGIRIDTGLAPTMWVNATPDQLRHKSAPKADVDAVVKQAKDAMAAKLEQVKKHLDDKMLTEQIAQRDKYIDDLGDRVKNGERIGTFVGTKNVDLQSTLLKCIGERDALKEALEHLPSKPSTEHIADNPQSWVGRTFVYDSGDIVLKCTDIVGKYASFEDVKMHYHMTNEISKFKEMLKSGMYKVQEDKPVEPQNEDIFQKAERIGKEASKKSEVKATIKPTATPATAETAKAPVKEKASKKKVKPEQQVGDLFADSLFDKEEENGLERNHDAVRTQGLPSDGNRNGRGRSVGSDRKITPQGSGRPDGSRKGESGRTRGEVSQSDRRPDGRLQGLDERKNARNNHSERGADHAPTSVNGRIEANVKAIELAHELLESGETATPEQMGVLRQFSGWGGLGGALDYRGSDWKIRERNKKIRELLGEEAYGQAVMSANSAYYTPAYVVDTLWDIAKQLGFKGGNILEGSAGIGNILGQMPMDVSERSDIHAIEIDGTSGGILSLLYPDAKVDIQGFEQTRIPNGSVDLAITNVPFVTGLRVNDTTGDSDLSKKFHNIHDFCIAKNVRKLREGGLGIFISSNGTLDNSKTLRDWVVNEGGSDFIGAFRMNNKTFGGTTVTSDIIVIRKRVNGQKSAQAIDVSTISGERTAEYQEPGARKARQYPMDYNKYFIEHPDHMAGEMRFAFEEGDTFRPTSKGLYPVSGKDQGKMLQEFVNTLAAENLGGIADGEATIPNVYEQLGGDVKEGSMVIDGNGNICIAQYGKAVPMMSELSKADKAKGNVTEDDLRKRFQEKKIKGHTKAECFRDYTAIKEALADVMKYQTENVDNAGLKPLIAKLNKAFDNFVNTYGHFNKNNQLAWLRNDVDYPNVFSLETYKEQGDGKGGVVKTYGKADVMKGRVVEKESEPHPENVRDGVVASMFKNGRIDVPYIAEQLGKSEEAVKREIIDSGLGFEDPATRQVEVSYQYLSGNVREKLRQAEANNENGEYTGNIKALQEVVPMDIPAHLIDFTLGSSWLSPKYYNEYVKDRTDIGVKFTAVGGSWFMDEPYYVSKEKNRAMGVVSEKLNKTIFGHELIKAAIQNKTITVSKTEKHWDGTTETIVDREATAACAAKVDEIRQDFKDWMRQKMQSDADLSARMEKEYNDRFNNYVPMRIPKDFVPEYFGGATHKFKMRPHQGKSIVRGTMQPLLLAHEVGTGKTFTLISTAMEMRRLGTARKPMIVVQNATVGQFAESAKELYPNAKILTLDDSDRNAEGRKNFYAKIKYNDWDMIVVPQSTFEFIPDSKDRQMQFVQDKIEEKMLVLEKMREADSSGRDPMTRRAEKELADLEAEKAALTGNGSTKRTANNEKKKAVAKQNAAVKAQEMLDRRTDEVEDFDDMGIDALLIDEAHEYKHLGFATAMQRGVKGVDPSYSKKSQGVYLKTQAVLEKNNGRNVIFATGTPISNTAAEIWTFMRYLMPKDTMKEYGIYYFDDFVRNFGNIQQMLEFNTSGKFKEVNRFAGYVNLPELVRIWSGVADTVLTKDQTELVEEIPEMEGGKAQDIYLPQTRALRSVMKYVRKQLEDFEQMSGKEKKENSHIPLTMYGIAQRAAVDARLVQIDAEDDIQSKTNEAVRQALRSLKETDGYKGTVAIFADHFQNKRSGFNLYEDIKKKLVAQGVPADEIVVMKSGMTIKKKLEIFDKVNHGEVRVILGSTATLGTGVNIQERLHTLIHLDAPNRPMDYTQRNGRILRQGNLHKEWGKPVRVLRFGVEDSLDVTAYQRLKTKGAIADSVMEGDRLMQDSMNNRVLEEEEDVFGDTVAQLSGSEYALLKNNAEKNVRKYESRRKQWEADQTYIHNAKPKLQGQIKAAEQRAEEANAHLLAVQKAFPDGKFAEITVGKQKFGTVGDMAEFIKEQNKKVLDAMKAMKETPSAGNQTNLLTLSLGGYDFVVKTEMWRETNSKGGMLFAEVHRTMTYSCPELGLTDVPVKQSLLRNAVEDITENVITGKDFAERFDMATRSAEHGRSELEQLKSREGKPFEFGKELEEAKRQLEEYTEAMKAEMAEKEKKYAEMDASVEAATDVAIDEEDEDEVEKFREGDEDLEYVNEEFNEELQEQIDGTLPEGHIYQMGMPGEILRSTGVPYLPIQMSAKKLQEKATMFGHDFELSEVRDLVKALQNPLAVFAYGDETKAQNIIVPLQKDGKNFIVGLSLNPVVGGRSLEINSIRNVFPKDNAEWLNWISQGKSLYLDKEKVQTLIDQQRTNLADVEYLDLDSVANVLEKPQTTNGLGRNLQQAMTDRVHELAESLNTPVRIVRTDEEVAALPSARQRRMKGSFNPLTGEVTIVVPNNANMADVENTFVHEVVGHDGLRVLFPEKEKLDNALDELYRVSNTGIQQTIDRMAQKMYDAEVDRLREKKRKEHEAKGEDSNASYYADMAEAHVEASKKRGQFRRDATEEYGADLAGRIGESGFERMSAEELTFWGKLKAMLQKALQKLLEGLKIPGKKKWSDKEWAFVLHEAYKRKKNGGKPTVFDAADTEVMRRKTGFDKVMYSDGKRELSPNYTMPPHKIDEQHYIPYVGGMHLNTALRWLRAHPLRVSYREVFDKPTLEDYFVDTWATFDAVDLKGRSIDDVWQEMTDSGKYEWHKSPKSSSEYLIDYGTGNIYRKADHWGRVSSCRWALRDNGNGKFMDKDSYAIGRANISDFNGITETRSWYTPENDRLHYVDNPWVEEYKKELEQSIVNYENAMRNVPMTDGVRERMGKAKARLEKLLELTNERQKISVDGIMYREGNESAAREELDRVNGRFNEQLGTLTEKNADSVVFSLGRPSALLQSAGVENKPMKLYGNKVMKKMRKHGFALDELRDLPRAVADPIAVFNNYGEDGNRSILTEMKAGEKNILVSITVGKGNDVDFNLVSSVFGKGKSNVVDWINKGYATYFNKKKTLDYLNFSGSSIPEASNNREEALNYLHHSALRAVTSESPRLSSAAKIVENFENPRSSAENVADEGIMFRDGDSEEYAKAMARDAYERRVASGMYQTREALQDSMLGLKEAMEAILKAEGGTYTGMIEEVAGYENAYLGENRLSSTNQAECAEFARRLFKPMLEEVAKLAKTADERAELTGYMMAKHGLERNEVMARRAAEKKANGEFGADIRKAERAVNKNPLDQDATDALDGLRRQRDDREQELYFENRGKDYSGLTALTGMDNVVDAESEARQMVTDYENGRRTDELWDKVNAVTGATLLKTYESGLINKATYDDIKGMYTHYIPLRGFDDKTSAEAYAYLADKHSAFNAPIKTAKGRKSKADDPFANMEAMAESAIMQGNRNVLVKQKFLNFALNHPSDLVSVSDLWLRHDDVRDEWMPVNSGDIAGTEALNEDDSPAEVERKMRDFEAAMEQAAKSDPAHFKKQKDAPDIPYRVVESRDLRQHQVLVKRNGKDYILTINGSPRAAQALNGQTNPDNDLSGAIGAIMHLGEKVNRQLSAFYTTRNPDFVVSNFMRDMMYANTMVWVKESPNYAIRFHKNVAKCNPAMMKMLLAKLRNGTLDMNDETEKMFHQFMMNGGETGYSNIRDIEQRKNDIRRELKKMNGKLPVRKAWGFLGERLDEYNRAVENCARFAAFMTSRQLGRTIDRSIWDAKEISVNFNKKGSGAKFMGANGQTKAGNVAAFTSGLGRSLYVFWNAAIQGTANFGRQAKRHPKKAIAGAATMFLLGALMAYLGGEDGDDDGNKDAYYNLPEYVRRSNIVFRLPGMDRQWISIPLPVEYRAMYGMGELMVSAMSGREHYTDGELAHAMASQVSQLLPLDFMEGGGFHAFIPSSVKPVAEALGNKSWTGMPIYKKNDYNKDDPEWTKAYKSANPYLVGASEWLNEKTGGDRYYSGMVDINPAQVEHMLNGYFGGLSRTVDEMVKMGETAAGRMEYNPRNFMFVNRLVKSGDERTEYRAVNNAYFKIREESEALRKRLRRYENDTADGIFDYAEKIAWLNASPEYRVLETYEEYSGDIDDIEEDLKEAARNGASDEEIKGLEAELNQKKKELVAAVNAVRSGRR